MKISEALECLEKLKGMEISSMPFKDDYGIEEVDLNDIRKVGSKLNTDFREYTATIKQALLKSQENEKVLEIIKKKNVEVGTLITLIKVHPKRALDLYNESLGFNLRKWLKQEEFDLLKRWVEDEIK